MRGPRFSTSDRPRPRRGAPGTADDPPGSAHPPRPELVQAVQSSPASPGGIGLSRAHGRGRSPGPASRHQRDDGLRAQPTPEPLGLDPNVSLVLDAVRRVVFPLRRKGHERAHSVCQLVEVSRQLPKLLRPFIRRPGSLEHFIRTLDGTSREGIDLTHAEEAIQSSRDRRLACPSVLSPERAVRKTLLSKPVSCGTFSLVRFGGLAPAATQS